MKNLYYNNLVEMLMRNADGMRLGSIVRALYNQDCDLFDPEAEGKFQRIYTSVKRFLWTQRRLRRSPFERRRWGTYALRRHFVVQLELCFDDWEDEGIVLPEKAAPEPPAKPAAYMLDLFENGYSTV